MSASSSDRIVAQKLTETQIDSLLAKLISELPYTIPLTRRIQYQLKNPSPTAQVFLATCQCGNEASSIDCGPNAGQKIARLIPPHSTWLAAYIDLANPGQTQCWLFGSWELPDSYLDSNVERGLLNALFKHIYTTLVPQQPTEPSSEWLLLRDTGKYLSQPYDRNKILFGTVHDKVRQYMPEQAIKRIDSSYGKYILDLSSDSEKGVKLAEGYAFGDMTEDLLQMVLDRTPIPRTLKTLKSLLNVGLYHEGNVIGWGFVSKDGSLASLHTEPEHRGKGLAVVVGKELMRRQSEVFGADGMGYVHADVSESNIASNSVMGKLGGKVMWRVAWVEVDLSEVLGEEHADNK